jgi:hypothetical protein
MASARPGWRKNERDLKLAAILVAITTGTRQTLPVPMRSWARRTRRSGSSPKPFASIRASPSDGFESTSPTTLRPGTKACARRRLRRSEGLSGCKIDERLLRAVKPTPRSNGMTAIAWTPVLPEATPGGSLSAHLRHSRSTAIDPKKTSGALRPSHHVHEAVGRRGDRLVAS